MDVRDREPSSSAHSAPTPEVEWWYERGPDTPPLARDVILPEWQPQGPADPRGLRRVQLYDEGPGAVYDARYQGSPAGCGRTRLVGFYTAAGRRERQHHLHLN